MGLRLLATEGREGSSESKPCESERRKPLVMIDPKWRPNFLRIGFGTYSSHQQGQPEPPPLLLHLLLPHFDAYFFLNFHHRHRLLPASIALLLRLRILPMFLKKLLRNYSMPSLLLLRILRLSSLCFLLFSSLALLSMTVYAISATAVRSLFSPSLKRSVYSFILVPLFHQNVPLLPL